MTPKHNRPIGETAIDPRIRSLKDAISVRPNLLIEALPDTKIKEAWELIKLMKEHAVEMNRQAWSVTKKNLQNMTVEVLHRRAGRSVTVRATFLFKDKPGDPTMFLVKQPECEKVRLLTLPFAMKWVLN